MTARLNRLSRTVAAAACALAVLGGSAACSSSGTDDAAKEVGSRNGDGSLTLIEEGDREEPVELSGDTIQGKTWDSADHRGSVVVVNANREVVAPAENSATSSPAGSAVAASSTVTSRSP